MADRPAARASTTADIYQAREREQEQTLARLEAAVAHVEEEDR